MTRQYPTRCQDEMLQRMIGGDRYLPSVLKAGVPEQILHHWNCQALIDAGLAESVESAESAALLAANKWIKSSEKSLHLVKDASENHDSKVLDPRGDRPSRKDS